MTAPTTRRTETEAAFREFAAGLERELTAVESVGPEHLGALFRSVALKSPFQGALLNELHKFLLKRTVQHARRHAIFFRDRSEYAEWHATPPGEPPDISCWPIINRRTVTADFHQFLADDVSTRSVCHTSGTTGQPLELYKSFEEVSFLRRFFPALFGSEVGDAGRPLSLSFPTAYHGVPVPLPSPTLSFVGGVTDDTLIKDAVRVLGQEYQIPGYQSRISVLSGLAFHVLFFTNFLLEQGVDPRDFNLSAINIAGGFVAAHWTRLLEDTWGAMVNNRFSLTEAMGGATRSPVDGLFYMDPFLYAEVIDVDSEAPVHDGVGRLVITNLYPLVQKQPLIRYDTGDLVAAYPRQAGQTLKFRFLGRRKNAISTGFGPERKWLMFSADLHEILAEIPDIRIYDWFSNVRAAKDRTVGSLPVMAVEIRDTAPGHPSVTLSIELRYSPHCFPDRVRELEATLCRELREAEHTSLGRRIDRGEAELDVQFFSPGALERPIVIKV